MLLNTAKQVSCIIMDQPYLYKFNLQILADPALDLEDPNQSQIPEVGHDTVRSVFTEVVYKMLSCPFGSNMTLSSKRESSIIVSGLVGKLHSDLGEKLGESTEYKWT